MAFIKVSGNVVSFAEFQDVLDRDQRLFDANEGLNDENVIDPLLIRATERILSKIRQSSWWTDRFDGQSVPTVNANQILTHQSDFSDLCVYAAFADYILPMIADFGSEDNNEKNKIGYYKQRAEELFMELIKDGSWYDFNADGVVSASEVKQGKVNLKRVR